MAKAKSQKSLSRWTKPASAIKAMDAKTYAASSAKKRKDTASGKQFSKQPKKAAATSKLFRKA
jgi:hypothetical protein